MKIIQSAGGPLIGLSRVRASFWSGVFGKTFIGQTAPCANDYEALERVIITEPPTNIAKIEGAILIFMPFETAIIKSDIKCVYIAQVEYADQDWSFEKIKQSDFLEAIYQERVEFISDGGHYILFDSAYSVKNLGEDYLSFELDKGNYSLQSSVYVPDSSTSLLLYKVSLLD